MARKTKPPPKDTPAGMHTPGPWEYGTKKAFVSEDGAARLRPAKGWFFRAAGERSGPANLDIGEVYHTASQSADTQEANARLIAAAPDLLAACEAVVNAANTYTEPIHYKVREAIEVARAAIAKANEQ